MKRFFGGATLGLAAAAIALAPTVPAFANDGSAGGAPAGSVLVSILTAPRDGSAVTVVAAGIADPKAVNVAADTLFTGVCTHCTLPMKFKASDAAKKCAPCGCDATNADCIIGETVKPETWNGMLQLLPFGTALHATYAVDGNPDSGFKTLAVDFHTVLLAVDGVSGLSADQLGALVKPVGGANAQLIDGGKRLVFSTKEEWNAKRETKLEQLVTQAGGKVVRATQAPAAAH